MLIPWHNLYARSGGFSLDPGREQPPLVSLVPAQQEIHNGQVRVLVLHLPEVLIKVGISDLLQGHHVIDRDEVAVQVHVLDTNLFKNVIYKDKKL